MGGSLHTIKLRESPKALSTAAFRKREVRRWGNAHSDGKNLKDTLWVIRSQAPKRSWAHGEGSETTRSWLVGFRAGMGEGIVRPPGNLVYRDEAAVALILFQALRPEPCGGGEHS